MPKPYCDDSILVLFCSNRLDCCQVPTSLGLVKTKNSLLHHEFLEIWGYAGMNTNISFFYLRKNRYQVLEAGLERLRNIT